MTQMRFGYCLGVHLSGGVVRELLSYTVGPWFGSHVGDIFRHFLLPIQLVITARITRLPSPVT